MEAEAEASAAGIYRVCRSPAFTAPTPLATSARPAGHVPVRGRPRGGVRSGRSRAELELILKPDDRKWVDGILLPARLNLAACMIK